MPTRTTQGRPFPSQRDASRFSRQGPVGVASGPSAEGEAEQLRPPSARQKSLGPANFGAPLGRGRSVGATKSAAKVITIVGDFSNPWKKRLQEEMDGIANRKWSPSIDDFHAVSGRKNVVTCSSFHEMLGVIHNNRDRSVGRINLFTHASRGSISFTGSIDPANGYVNLDHNTALNDSSLHAAYHQIFTVGKRRFKLDDVRKRFAKGAQVVFYACNSGTDTLLLQAVANALKVIASGFSDKIAYCPKFQRKPARIDRGWIGIGGCSKATRDVSTLKPDRRRAPRAVPP